MTSRSYGLRISGDESRKSAVARLHATGQYSVKALAKKAYEIGLRHSRGDRRMTPSEIHRMLQNPIYTGDFQWLGKLHKGSHEPLVSRDTFDRVQDVLAGKCKGRGRYSKHQHPFMGLVTCGRCGCSMTAEKKKGKYVYYRCTGARGRCGNTYVPEEQLSDLLGTAVLSVEVPAAVADGLAAELQASEAQCEQARAENIAQLQQRRRSVTAKMDRAYDDYLNAKITDEFWTRKSEE